MPHFQDKNLFSDYRFKSREDLKLDIKPLKLHCPQCWQEINATHFEVWESERLGVKKTVEITAIENLTTVCNELCADAMR